ncbi:MAG: STAS domain-containing protein [Anaerolineales bacterium]|nr:STAS domain-containing protein [Anaerolineales bacterium]
MPTKHLEVKIRYQARVAIIDLSGEINASADETLKPAYLEAIETNPRVVLLNMTQVEYINSTGIAILVELLAQAYQANHRLAACGLSSHYQEVFQIVRMTDYMELFADESSALSTL